MIETGLWKYLAADPTVSGLVGSKIYRDMILPKGYDLPALMFFQIHAESFESLDGDNPTELKRFQFSCFGRTYDAAKNLAAAVRSLLVPKSDGSGATQTVTFDLPDGTHIQSARLHDERDLPSEEGIGETIRHSMIEVEFVYENS